MNAVEGELRLITAGEMVIEYRLVRKNVKNMNLRVRPDGTVMASAPRRVEGIFVDRFVARQTEFILRAKAHFRELEAGRPEPKTFVTGETVPILGQDIPIQVEKGKKGEAVFDGRTVRITARNPESDSERKRLIARLWEDLCREELDRQLRLLHPRLAEYQVPFPTYRLRDMKGRWGSCIKSKAAMTFNKRLLCAPPECVEFVVCHELCHLVHADHSRRFYDLLTQILPDWRERKAELGAGAPRWLARED